MPAAARILPGLRADAGRGVRREPPSREQARSPLLSDRPDRPQLQHGLIDLARGGEVDVELGDPVVVHSGSTSICCTRHAGRRRVGLTCVCRRLRASGSRRSALVLGAVGLERPLAAARPSTACPSPSGRGVEHGERRRRRRRSTTRAGT